MKWKHKQQNEKTRKVMFGRESQQGQLCLFFHLISPHPSSKSKSIKGKTKQTQCLRRKQMLDLIAPNQLTLVHANDARQRQTLNDSNINLCAMRCSRKPVWVTSPSLDRLIIDSSTMTRFEQTWGPARGVCVNRVGSSSKSTDNFRRTVEIKRVVGAGDCSTTRLLVNKSSW